jgi:hypothetical protein
VKKLIALLVVAGMLSFSVGCSGTPTSKPAAGGGGGAGGGTGGSHGGSTGK